MLNVLKVLEQLVFVDLQLQFLNNCIIENFVMLLMLQLEQEFELFSYVLVRMLNVKEFDDDHQEHQYQSWSYE